MIQISEYVIVLTARRWRWLPWPTNTFTFVKRTSWQEAYDIAMQAAEAGAYRVSLYEQTT